MASDDKLLGPGRLRAFSPFLAPGERQQLHDVLNFGAGLPPSFADELRALARRYVDDGDSLKLRAVCLLVADLCEHHSHDERVPFRIEHRFLQPSGRVVWALTQVVAWTSRRYIISACIKTSFEF